MLCKYEDLSLEAQHTCENPCIHAFSWNTMAQEGRHRRIQGIQQPAQNQIQWETDQEKKAEYGIAWHMISYSSLFVYALGHVYAYTHILGTSPAHNPLLHYSQQNTICPHKSSLDLCFQLNSHVYVVSASVVNICICYLNCFKKLFVIFVKCFSVLCFRPKPWWITHLNLLIFTRIPTTVFHIQFNTITFDSI